MKQLFLAGEQSEAMDGDNDNVAAMATCSDSVPSIRLDKRELKQHLGHIIRNRQLKVVTLSREHRHTRYPSQ